MRRNVMFAGCLASIFILLGEAFAWDPNLLAQYNFTGNVADSVTGRNSIVVGGGELFYAAGAQGGQSVNPNGSQYIDCNSPILPNYNNQMTVTAWVKRSVPVPDNNWSTIAGNSLNWGVESGYGICEFRVGGDYVRGPNIDNNKWHHIVGVYDRFAGTQGKIRLYVDKQLIQDKDANSFAAEEWGNVWIGQIDYLPDPCIPDSRWLRFFHGAIDDVRIYNRALTQTDINSIYGPGPRDPNLLARWKFEGNTGNYAGGHFVEEVNKSHITYVAGPNFTNTQGLTMSDLGKAIHFDGNSWLFDNTFLFTPVIGTATNYVYVKEATICNWLKTDEAKTSGTADWIAIINNAGNWDISIGFNTSMLFWAPTPNMYSPSMLAPGLEDGKWHHLANIYNMHNYTAKIYWDGVLIGTKNLDSQFAGGQNFFKFWIAACSNYLQGGHPIDDYDVVRRFKGSLDDLRVYDIALTLGDITDIIKYPDPIPSPPRPTPRDGEVDIPLNTTLKWTIGYDASYHDLYFGSGGTLNFIGRLPRTTTTYKPPSNLLLNQLYQWKIDEVNAAGGIEWPAAQIWSFTTIPYAVYDDFETYTSQSLLVVKWKKYSTSSTLVKASAPYVHNGTLAILVRAQLGNPPYVGGASRTYSNTAPYNMVTLDGNSPNQDMKAYSLWFISKTSLPINVNKAPIYVELKDNLAHTGRIYWGNGPTGDANASQVQTWTQWDIALQDFVNKGVDVTKITSITIGIGTGAQIGSPNVFTDMWFDDIRFYVPRCIPPLIAGNYNNDCLITAADLAIFSTHWLEIDCGSTGNCGGSDLDLSGSVDESDFAIFAQKWLQGPILWP